MTLADHSFEFVKKKIERLRFSPSLGLLHCGSCANYIYNLS